MRIAFIDNEPEILEVYSFYLDDLASECKISGSYFSDSEEFEAQDRVERLVGDFDAIFCDLAMPVFDGRNMLDAVLKARRALNRSIPFFIVTGASSDYCPLDDNGWGKLNAADDVVDKPLNFTDFRALLLKHGLLLPNSVKNSAG